MTRYRLSPTLRQEILLREHCAHARFVWNLAVEQQSWWRPGRSGSPAYLEQCRQLTAARAEHPWLGAGSQMVQQQALRDFDQAMKNFFAGTHGRPRWRKAGRDEGFRVVAVKPEHIRRLAAKSVPSAYLKQAGYGSAGLGPFLPQSPTRPPWTAPDAGMRLLEHKAARQHVRGRPASARLKRTRRAIARLRAREADARKDWTEKVSTDLSRRFDVIRVEDLRVNNVTR